MIPLKINSNIILLKFIYRLYVDHISTICRLYVDYYYYTILLLQLVIILLILLILSIISFDLPMTV